MNVSCYNFYLFSECGHKTIILVPYIMHTTHKCTGATNNRHPSPRGQALTHSIDGTGGGLNFPSTVYAQNELFGGECEQVPQLIIQWKFVRPCVRLSGLNATGIYMCGTHGCHGCFHCACSIHCKQNAAWVPLMADQERLREAGSHGDRKNTGVSTNTLGRNSRLHMHVAVALPLRQ